MLINRSILCTVLLSAALVPACDSSSGGRYPLNTEDQWDPNLPPTVFWDYATPIINNDNLEDGLSLRTADGVRVSFSIGTSDAALWLCVPGGLQPGEAYIWEVGPFGESWHQSEIPRHDEEGTWTFTTSTDSDHDPPDEDCTLPDSPAYDGSGAEIDTDTIEGTTFEVVWDADAVELHITNGDPSASYWFGLVETGCGDPEYCWSGEDCIYGYAGYFYCHPSGTDGVSLRYGGAYDNLEEGVETVFGGSSFDGTVTYYVEDGSDCWIWGHDPSYYDGLGCQP